MEQRNHTPEFGRIQADVFNLDVMTEDQIIVSHRGLAQLADAGPNADDSIDQTAVGDNLSDRLVSGIRELASRDPERLKHLVHRCVTSNNDADRLLGVYVAPSLVAYDYGFTRDALVYSMVDQATGRVAWHGIAEAARLEARELFRDSMSPVQRADFNDQLAFYGNDIPIEPAPHPDTQMTT
jgi:hypothetical protein